MLSLAALALVPAAAAATVRKAKKIMPPAATKIPHSITQLGRTRNDEYAWLKDANWQEVMRDPKALQPAIRTHLEAENAYTKAIMSTTEALQEKLFAEMKGRIKEDDWSVPDADGPWEYYSRYAAGAQHPIYARRPRAASPGAAPRPGQDGEQILLDADAQAKGKAYYSVGAAGHSSDHALYAYAVDEQGSEFYTIRLRDPATGEELPEPPESSTGDFVFSPDSAYLFWLWRDANGRPSKVYRRPARGRRADDELIYHEADEGFFISLEVTENRRFILISAGDHETSEVRLIPAAAPRAQPIVFAARAKGVMYDPTHWNGRWLIRTNADGATDFKIAEAAEGATARSHWKDFLPHRPGHFQLGLAAFKNHLVRLERVDALPRLIVCDQAGAEHVVSQAEEAYDLELDPGYEYDTPSLRFVYQSPTMPRQWFDYDMNSRARALRKTQEIPSGHDPSVYVAKRISAKAADGAEVPITLLMRKGTPLDGSAPLLLYGYGSYGMSMDADFSIRRLSLVDRGWIWAIAHVRGGSEKGWNWFLDGRKFKKKNTFTDFVACAETLIERGYTSKGRIVIYGGSAGGMLMGAAANLRPDLWAGVVAAVPFVDVLNTMSDPSLPLTPPEWPEWGNPIEDEQAYDYIASYSPYDNVGAKPYPAVLATGGLSDPRVTYWEPTKWAARLRDHTTGVRPILLKINMEAGHGGAAGRFDFLKEIALDFAFALKAMGAAEAGGAFSVEK